MPRTVDLVCLSHLRWDFVYQRPQHLMSRFGRDHRVFFIEEPVFGDGSTRMDLRGREREVQVVVPHLPHGAEAQVDAIQEQLINTLFSDHDIHDFVLW